ncbi:Short-chain type dehydrogenase/reductase [Pseudomonas reidholzensis]|uniref:Short-chain type dehydrogenase/reductase n=1 Tax=Pseudomonas reidholzensis TaxID=1785162 RepID=A0A383RU22_9PSED|nr:SDR family oxidoreductase [Pseudomonas reidholzensis]SYX90542.1 Short-chain type dehydrogenase/reductase [Pseudomonas reidholzensis]
MTAHDSCSASAPVQTAIITGASGGIGRAIALRLAADGLKVAVHYSGNAAKAQEVVAAIQAAGGEAISVQADVSDAADVQRLFATTQEAFGAVSAVVHSAAVMHLAAITPDSIEVFDRVVQTNLRGAFLVMAQAAQHVHAGGRIVALSTSVIAKSFPEYGPYIAAKAGVEGLVRVLANELRGRAITVNAVAPGPVATELFLEGKTDQQIAQLSKVPPLERLGEPDDIARVVAFLVGAEGGWVNAQVVRANGGFA